MKDIWVISDTHFGHENIIGYGQRPFHDVIEQDEYMIDKWNSVVMPGDKVYHLGDVYMGSGEHAWYVLSKLHGQKRLVVGNHDDLKSKVLHKFFQKISMWRIFKDHGIIMTHVPLHPDNSKGLLNVHGHIHQNKSPEGPYRCVCVEQIGYTPIHIEELRIR